MKHRKPSRPKKNAARRAPARASAAKKSAPPPDLVLLRHTVATLAYRAGKALRGAPPEYAAFCAAPGVRTPGQILAHMGDLFDWALSIARGDEKWHNSAPRQWNDEVARFFSALEAFDAYLASGAALHASVQRLFQGPVADALQHTGQLTILRRAGGAPIRGENYSRADIVTGRVGAQQTSPRREFD